MGVARRFYILATAITLIIVTGCSADPTRQLEGVAKDWSRTIRASQVIPVYPPRADIRPGDVFLVPTSIKNQTRVYDERGFLPITQLVVRLHELNFQRYYAAGYWDTGFQNAPHDPAAKPKPQDGNQLLPLKAPRVAFPSYSFTVARSGGLKLALPIKGVPVGLGLMGASQASGTVTLGDAYSYGVDGQQVYQKLHDWAKGPVRRELMALANASSDPVYLRMVTQVYLVREIDITLSESDELAGGVDAGAAQNLSLPKLDASDEAKAEASTKALQRYNELLGKLSDTLNGNAVGAPGGSVRFTNVSSTQVSMKQSFEQPLAIGFVGFDVLVSKEGLSPPIPSFSVLSRQTEEAAFEAIPFSTACQHGDWYSHWLIYEPGSRKEMVQIIEEQGKGDLLPGDVAFNDQHCDLIDAAYAKHGPGDNASSDTDDGAN